MLKMNFFHFFPSSSESLGRNPLSLSTLFCFYLFDIKYPILNINYLHVSVPFVSPSKELISLRNDCRSSLEFSFILIDNS
jgi:hypothetical protein